MTKNVIREIIIILLLCLAIILLLGILLYEYVPFTKTIPTPVSYTTPDNVKQELANTDEIDESKVIMTYEVDSTDLNNYKRIQNYKPGKANPFSSYEVSNDNPSTGSGNASSNSGTANSGTSENNTSDNTTTSGGQFFQNKGTK